MITNPIIPIAVVIPVMVLILAALVVAIVRKKIGVWGKILRIARVTLVIVLVFFINLRIMGKRYNVDVELKNIDVLFVVDTTISMWAEDYNESIKECLKKYGFKLRHELLVDNGTTGREETYELNGVSIDIFYIYPALDRYPYCCDFISVQGTVSFIDSMKKFGYNVNSFSILY